MDNFKLPNPVLIVDDVRAPRRVLKRLLQNLGISAVDEAETGTLAIEKIKQEQFSIIFCDFHLGEMNGVEILRMLREDPKTSNTPFIMITSDVSKEEFEEAKKADVSAYMLKPFTMEHLQENIRLALKKHGLD